MPVRPRANAASRPPVSRASLQPRISLRASNILSFYNNGLTEIFGGSGIFKNFLAFAFQ
jgi:hypothetical protein